MATATKAKTKPPARNYQAEAEEQLENLGLLTKKLPSEKTKPLTDVERAEGIENFLAIDLGDGQTIRQWIVAMGVRELARESLASGLNWWSTARGKFSSGGYRGLLVAGSQGVISWDDVIDEAIDADAGEKKWEPPAAKRNVLTREIAEEIKFPCGHTLAESLDAMEAKQPRNKGDVILGPNGPVDAATAKQVNGKPRKTASRAAEPKSAAPETGAASGPPENGPVHKVPIDWLAPNQFQPRMDFDRQELADLAESLQTHGFISPITVRPIAQSGAKAPRFEIIAGERRHRAAELANFAEVPIVVRMASDAEMAELAIVENDQRADLNPIERAEAYQRILKEARGTLTQEQLGKRLKRSQAFIANALRLLELPAEWRARIISRQMSPSHGRELLAIAKWPAILKKIERAIEDDEEEEFPSLVEFQRAIQDAIQQTCEPLNGPVWDGHTGRQYPPLPLTAEQIEQLEVLENVGHWHGAPGRFAANVKLFRKIRDRYIAEQRKLLNEKEKTAGKASGKKKGRAEATASARNQQIEWEKWQINWRRWLIHTALSKLTTSDPLFDAIFCCALFAPDEFDVWSASDKIIEGITPRRAKQSSAERETAIVAAILALNTEAAVWDGTRPRRVGNFAALKQRFALHVFAIDPKRGPNGRGRLDALKLLVVALGINPLEVWQRELAGPLTDAFFNLHSKEQLVALAGELGVHIDGAKGKETIVKQLKASSLTKHKLPAELDGKSSKTKGRREP